MSLLAIVPNIFVVYHEVPAKNLREFVALAKAKPGPDQLRQRRQRLGGPPRHGISEAGDRASSCSTCPTRAPGPNVTDLIAGRTQATSAGTPPLMPHVKSGKLRVIAVGTSKRLHSLPEVATVAEQGYPGFETSQWYGLNAPAGTPEPIMRRLAEEAAKAAKSALVRRALQAGRRRGGRLDAAGIRRVHREGAGALEQGRARGEHQGGLMYRRHRCRRRQRRALRGAVRAGACERGSGPRARARGRGRRQLALHRRAACASSTTASTICKQLMPDLSDEEIARTDFGTYTDEQFFDDMARVTEYRCDPDLDRAPGRRRASPTCCGCASKGVRFTADLRPAGVQDRRPVQVLGRADASRRSAAARAWSTRSRRSPRKSGIEIRYGARAVSLIARRRRRPRRAS